MKLAYGTVMEENLCQPGVQELRVQLQDGAVEKAIHYTDIYGPVAIGCRVVLNVTAVQLGLGSGGAHFVHHVLGGEEQSRQEKAATAGHIMKLRYTPQQRTALSVEEAASPHHELFRGRPQLDGMPVLIGELHSMLPIAVAWLMAARDEPAAASAGEGASRAEALELGDSVGLGCGGEDASRAGALELGDSAWVGCGELASREAVEQGDGAGVGGELASRDAVEQGASEGVGCGELASQGPAVLPPPDTGSAAESIVTDAAEPIAAGGLRLSYVMTDGGALPLAYSRHVADLTACGWLVGTVTYGHAYGGSLEAVNKFTALLAARHVHRADIAIVTMGPGIVGTDTRLGHTAVETAELVHAVLALGGRPILMPRLSFADPRERHRGLGAHTLTALGDLCLAPATMPLPAELPPEARAHIDRQLEETALAETHYIPVVTGMDHDAIARRMAQYALPITTMGRQLEDDPAFWAGVCAAAEFARQLI